MLLPIFLLSKVRFYRCAETRRSRAKSPRSTAASSSPWTTFLSTVCSDPPHAQPVNETFALKIRPRILNIHSTPRLLCASGSYLVHSGPYVLSGVCDGGGIGDDDDCRHWPGRQVIGHVGRRGDVYQVAA